jgi:hypothetical protein
MWLTEPLGCLATLLVSTYGSHFSHRNIFVDFDKRVVTFAGMAKFEESE